MIVKLKRSHPPGGPWMLYDSTGRVFDFIKGPPGFDAEISADVAYFEAVPCDTAGWDLTRRVEDQTW